MRRRVAEASLAHYLLATREQWHLVGIPKNAMLWYQIGQELHPFTLESHLRAMIDRTIGQIARSSSLIIREDQSSGVFYYYYSPDPNRKFLVSSFPKSGRLQREVAFWGAACHGTGCAGEGAMLLRECSRYVDRTTRRRIQPEVVFNVAPQVCFSPVNVGTELAYDVCDISFRTVNIFLDPEYTKISVTVFPE